jgi:predicted nuclease with TOPRIM domain
VLQRARREKREKKVRRADPGLAGKQLAALRKERDALTDAIERHEGRVHEINEIFCDPTYFDRAAPKEVRKLEEEQKRLAAEIETLMSDWERVERQLAELAD